LTVLNNQRLKLAFPVARKRDIGIADTAPSAWCRGYFGHYPCFGFSHRIRHAQVRVQFGCERLLEGARERRLEHALDVVNILEPAILYKVDGFASWIEMQFRLVPFADSHS